MRERVGELYTPSKWGTEYHSNTCDEVLGAGSAGPGKTMCLMMDPIYQVMVETARVERDPAICGALPDTPLWDTILQNPLRPGHSVGWALHLRRTSNMLLPTMARANRIFTAIDPGVQFRSRENIHQFSCGYRFQWGHCKDPDDWDIYMSAEFTHIGWDELVQFMEEQWSQINTRLRTDDPVLARMRRVRAMSNPLMRKTDKDAFLQNDPHWVRRYFVEPAPEGRKVLRRTETRRDGTVVAKTRMYIPATLFDNPNKEFVREYEATLLHAKPHIRKALLYGDWYVSAGSFYADEWDPSIHVVRPFTIPSDWPMFRSMDWGFKSPGTVGWFAIDEDDNLYLVKELNFQRKSATWVAKKIREIETEMKLWGYDGQSRLMGPADTQLWEERGESGVSKAAEMAEVGVLWEKANKKSRQRNAERLAERLADHGEHTSQPGLMIFAGCRMSIRTIPAIQTSATNPEEPADGGEDHWHDMICYACAYASAGRLGIAGIAPDLDEYEQSETPERGTLGYGGY